MSIQVSVVVPTYQRPEMLERCLAALLAQEFDPAAYEVIVADDAACEQTRQLVVGAAQAYPSGCPRPCVRYIALAGAHGPAAARNAGWRAARGPIIAFTDDDCIPDPNWLAAGLAALAGGQAAASGRIIVPLAARPTDYEQNVAWLEHAEFATANCLCRRDALAAIGGFDDRFTAAWREDSDLHFALLERNERIVRAPAAIVIHPVRPGRWGVSLAQQRKSMFNALLYKKHPALYRQRIQAWPPWQYYGIVGALLAALAGALARRPRLGWVGLSIWLLLSGRFCLRRLRHTSRAPWHVGEMLVTSALIPPLALFWRIRGALAFRVFFL
jgi:glycosyltransferase involved in cell wall biosynthesis